MAAKLFATVRVPVNPVETRKRPTVIPLMFNAQSTWLPPFSTFWTTVAFRMAPLIDAGPLNVCSTMSPRDADQKYPTSVLLMNPTLATTVDDAEGNSKTETLGAVDAPAAVAGSAARSKVPKIARTATRTRAWIDPIP